ncbi:MAG: hypothetical protein OSJ45_04045 [Lachnospiraceae bacterium]|nr:hypothetical protein [Lachnospiraceae bacterium]
MKDIKKENRQEETVENKAELATVPGPDTKIPEDAYVLTLAKPYTYEDKTYKELVFDFESLTGMDMISIETEMTTMGEVLLSPEISLSFLSRMAARAAKIGSDVILHLPFREFAKVKNRAQNFLIDTGFTGRIL